MMLKGHNYGEAQTRERIMLTILIFFQFINLKVDNSINWNEQVGTLCLKVTKIIFQ